MAQKFVATGGTPPYTFTVTDGSGTIDASGGTYTAPSTAGTATIRVADTTGASLTAQIKVNPALMLTPGSATLTASSGQTLQFSSGGGGGGYKFSVASGSGTIDANGLYTAGNTAGQDVVQVSDSTGGITSVPVLLVRVRTNGTVNTLITDGSSTYLGGYFSAVNPYLTPRAAVLDPVSGRPILQCDLGMGFDAPVTTSLVVGTSLFVVGSFTSYKGHPAHGIAKLNAATCALDTTFTQADGFSGLLGPSSGTSTPPTVSAIASDGTALFVGGNFTHYRGIAANALVKIDLQSGTPDQTFTQPTGLDNSVIAIAASADSVYLSGDFNYYRGAAVPHGAGTPIKLDASSGKLDPAFQPPSFTGPIVSLVRTGAVLYAAGNLPQGGIEKLDPATGAVDPVFAQGVGATQRFIKSIVVSTDSIFMVGQFTEMGGLPASGVAKIDAATGVADPSFNHAAGADLPPLSISISGSGVYIGGPFSTYAGQPAPGLARLDATSGAFDAAFGLIPGFDLDSIQSVVATSSAIFVSGSMLTYGGTSARNIAKVDFTTGAPDNTFLAAPGPDGTVSKLLLSGSSLYVGGQFTHYGNVTIAAIAKVDSSTGLTDTQFTQGSGFGVTFAVSQGNPANVTSMAFKDGALYAGGLFSTYRGQPAAALAKLNASSGVLDTTFTQPTGFTGISGPFYFPLQVNALALSANSLYVAGNFVQYRGAQQDLVAKIDPVTGALDPAFAPVTTLTAGSIQFKRTLVNALLISGDQLYIAGAPLVLAGAVQSSGLAKVNLLTGAPDAMFTQAVSLGDYSALTPEIHDLAQIGSSIYIAGNFTNAVAVGGAYPRNLAKYDSVSGAIDTTFSQPNGPDGVINSLTVSGSTLFVNGTFLQYRGTLNPYSIGLDPVSGATNGK